MAKQLMVCHFGSVVQTTSESSADRLKVGRTSKSNRIHILGNDSRQGKRNHSSSDFQYFFGTTFLPKSLTKLYQSMCMYIRMFTSIIVTTI